MSQVDTVETPKQRIERVAAELGLTMTSVFIPWSQSRNRGEKQPSLNWRVQLRAVGHHDGGSFKEGNGRLILETDYSAGSAHAPSYKQTFGKRTVDDTDRDRVVAWECEHGYRGRHATAGVRVMGVDQKQLMPCLADVLHSLSIDSDAIDRGSFEEWAADFGYDTDSRQAEKMYRQCLDIALKLRAAIGDEGLQKLRDACQDY